MKELTGEIHYQYRWWREDGKETRKCDIDALRTHAIVRIRECSIAGYKEGELHKWFRVKRVGQNNFVDYIGYWKTVQSGDST